VALEPSVLLAAEGAVDLGAALLSRGRSHFGSIIRKGERDYATAVDLEIERTIKGVLAEVSREIPFLGEEEGGVGIDASPLWVLDPIDGTINFSKASPLCGISLALIESGRPTFGIVDLPLLGERYVAAAGAGAYLNGQRMAVAGVEKLGEAVIGFADFAVGSQADSENRIHRELMRRLAAESLRVRVHGSASLDLAWLAAGRLSATIMLSNLPWDVAAGVLLVREAGGEAYDYDGSPYSSRSAFTLASVPGIAGELLCTVEESIDAVASAWPRGDS
jgi:myo-inositol-1(or 4)-monophosphatase